jgi:carboxyl-terminal processing protease
MRKGILTLLAILLIVSLEASPPNLKAEDVNRKLKEMTKAHARHKKLDTEITQRALSNYIDYLDPSKTYFLEEEVEIWVDAPQSTLDKVLKGYKRHDYLAFQAISNQMEKAIARRNAIEAELDSAPLPTGVQAEEFKNLGWANNESELKDRLLRLRSYQAEVAGSLYEEPAVAIQLMGKRRERRERELLGASPVDREKMLYANVLKATASALDSQTTYFTPDEASSFLIDLQQRLFGIGVQMRDNLNGFTVVRVIEGGPAYQEGSLRPEDLIVAVDGESVMGLDIQDAVQRIRGTAGTPVVLTVMRGQITTDVSIQRGEVVMKEQRIETSVAPYGDGVIGRIALYSFYQDENTSSTADINEAINHLKTQHNLKGLVLDLRRNTGGLLPQAIAVTGLFITKGVVASIRDNDGNIQFLRDSGGYVAWDGPLIVLTSRLSASASEIVAGALQDYGRAIIVGDETTYGKGTFQTSTIDLGGGTVDPKGEYKVTRGTYFTVSGRSPQLEGVKADVVAPSIFSELEIGERFSKYPLAPDAIPPNFEDDLSDIPFRYRAHVRKTYHHDLQQPTDAYTRFLPVLQENSQERQANSPEYQVFLASLRGDGPTAEEEDVQLDETYDVMRDLIILLENNPPQN